MLKVLAAVLAVLSAAISITIYTATLPAIQKQAADNAAAIEQNAEAIETLEDKKTYIHNIQITFSRKADHAIYNNLDYFDVFLSIPNNSNTNLTLNNIITYYLIDEEGDYVAKPASGQGQLFYDDREGLANINGVYTTFDNYENEYFFKFYYCYIFTEDGLIDDYGITDEDIFESDYNISIIQSITAV